MQTKLIIKASLIFLLVLGCSMRSKSTSTEDKSGGYIPQFIGIIEEISWNPNVPGPFGPENSFSFHLDTTQSVCVQYYDNDKVFIDDLFKGSLVAGNYKLNILAVQETNKPPAGTFYHLKISIGEEIEMKKMLWW